MSREFQKGAFVHFSSLSTKEKLLPFQYNPEQLTRVQNYNDASNTISESIRFTLVLHLDALPIRNNPDNDEESIYPQLKAFERLFKAQTMRLPAAIPGIRFNQQYSLIAFAWGIRVVPIRIQRFVIKEQIFNTGLEPVYATLDVQLRLLTAKELAKNKIGLGRLKQYRKEHLTSTNTP